MKGVAQAVTALFILLAATDCARALPRFASRTGARCQSCHVDPSGGAMRQTFGVQYGRSDLPLPAWSKDLDLEDFSNVLSNSLSVGADVRTLYFSQRIDSAASGASRSTNAFFEMQGDIYFDFKVSKKVSVFLNKGLTAFEVFGLLNILPAGGHIKIGKFVPNFGTRLDDHTAFVRTYTGFSPEQSRAERTGVELALAPGPLTFTGGIYNAEDGFGAGTGSKKAYLGRADGMFSIGSTVHCSLGADIYSHTASDGTITNDYGGLGSVSISSLTVFGEVDWISTKAAGATTKGLASSIEADYLLTAGLDLKIAYDFYDADIAVKEGALSRITAGFEFFPLPGVELRPLYRHANQTVVGVSTDQMELHLHFYL